MVHDIIDGISPNVSIIDILPKCFFGSWSYFKEYILHACWI